MSNKFFKIPYRIWWYIFLANQIFLLSLTIGTILTPTWFTSKNPIEWQNIEWSDTYNNIYLGEELSGSLFRCTTGCNKDWKSLSSNWCSYYEKIEKPYTENIPNSIMIFQVKSICSQYSALWNGMIVFIVLESTSIFFLLLWSIGMLCYMLKKKYLFFSSFFSAGAFWLSHSAGFLYYVIIARAKFNNKCSRFDSDGRNPEICASDGLNLALFVSIFSFLIVVLYFIVGCRLKKHGPEGLFRQELEKYHNSSNIFAPKPRTITKPSTPIDRNNAEVKVNKTSNRLKQDIYSES